jgi:uncharacterized damage-inducible protein DinB
LKIYSLEDAATASVTTVEPGDEQPALQAFAKGLFMPELIPWFIRSFPFPVPVELIPNIAARLRGTPARLEELLTSIDPGALVVKPSGGWSVQEHVGHLLDIEPLWLARVEDYAGGHPELTPADLQNRKTDAAGHNSRPIAVILQGFRDARAALLRRIDSPALRRLSATLPHPRLRTPMNLADHLYFVAEHDDHHLATIYERLTR